MDLSILVDGVAVPLLPSSWDDLTRAVINSLFTWRRARPDDRLPDGASRMGWFGDDLSTVVNDRFGSRLWLLAREALTPLTIARAREYAEEALAWLVEDGVATRVDVTTERFGLSGLAVLVVIWRHDGAARELRFSDVWGVING